MTDLFAARSQMAISLGFHIVFATIGMAMPSVYSKIRARDFIDADFPGLVLFAANIQTFTGRLKNGRSHNYGIPGS